MLDAGAIRRSKGRHTLFERLVEFRYNLHLPFAAGDFVVRIQKPRSVEEAREVGIGVCGHAAQVHVEKFTGEDGGVVCGGDSLADGIEVPGIGDQPL